MTEAETTTVKKAAGGAPLGNGNRTEHGLRCAVGRLPKGCAWIATLVAMLRRWLEAAIVERDGTIGVYAACVIATACKWEQHSLLAQRWLRLHGNEMSHADRLSYSREIAKASSRLRNSAARFARLWLGQWVRGTGDALDLADIEAAITQAGPLTESNVGRTYTAGLDLATKRDHAALVVLESNPATRRVRVASCQTWRPPIDLMNVQAVTEETARRFGATVHFDPHQAALLVAQLQAAGVRCEEMPFTGPNCAKMASTVLQIFRERRVDLYPDERLIGDLGRLVIVEKSFGYKLEASHDPNAGHADSAFALAVALPAAAEAAQRERTIVYESTSGWGAVNRGGIGSMGLPGF